ncbi:MarR family winged helix-turn-helix transcriptional regulator [Bacillus andreraoultii]|uniref:MarR family winged helix-turn-helix transcriptional regulator n=1 Tax=Bacillus andreraoultii TaxID=1499685 RepID=UPI00053BB9B3|nr:MarR family transcriptional regulator [Bacillus andreraoultii]
MEIDQLKKSLLSYSRKINDQISSLLSKTGAQYDLTNQQVVLLLKLLQDGSSTIGVLAEEMRMAGANISTMCKRLEQKGLLIRNRDENDERIVRISLSEQGNFIVGQIDHFFTSRIATVLKEGNEETFEKAILGLSQLHLLLKKI